MSERMKDWPGQSYPLGATWDGAGVNFALFSENATRVGLCLFDTREPSCRRKGRRLVKGGQTYRVESRSLALFRLQTEGDEAESGS